MRRFVPLLALASVQAITPAAADEAADVAVLRNTVVNILEAMVQKGLISKDAADKLVADAQAKADREAAAKAAGEAAQPGDVRVTYVPEIVKQEISQQVATDIEKKVTDDVVTKARTDGWGVPGALPGWVRDSQWSGDLRLRVAPIFLSDGNAQNVYRNFQAINEAGSEAKAGNNALLNTTNDEVKYNARVRFGVESSLSDSAMVGFRFATGDRDNPVSANVGLDNYNTGFEVRLDEAYLRLGGNLTADGQRLYVWGGRMRSPFEQTELVWDPDLRFNGLAAQYAWYGSGPRGLFANAGIFPLQGVNISAHDKWLAGAQFGVEWAGPQRATFTLATAYYDYRNETGRRNAAGSTEFNYTAPPFVQKGNTLFDISDPTNPNADLWALAADYGLLDTMGKVSVDFGPALRLDIAADYVTNLAYDEAAILQRTGTLVPKRANGWRAEMRIGTPRIISFGDWSFGAAYTYLERDAVLDGFADSDFHGGGTDAQGYTLSGEFGFTRNTWLRMRYLSANEIDGAPLAVDTLLIDLNAAF